MCIYIGIYIYMYIFSYILFFCLFFEYPFSFLYFWLSASYSFSAPFTSSHLHYFSLSRSLHPHSSPRLPSYVPFCFTLSFFYHHQTSPQIPLLLTSTTTTQTFFNTKTQTDLPAPNTQDQPNLLPHTQALAAADTHTIYQVFPIISNNITQSIALRTRTPSRNELVS